MELTVVMSTQPASIDWEPTVVYASWDFRVMEDTAQVRTDTAF